MALHLTDGEILDRARLLPAFPRVVHDVLETLDDEGATVGMLVAHVERDPVIAARVLSLANAAALSRGDDDVRDVRKAISRIGQSSVRKVVLGLSLADFARKARADANFWEHSVAVAMGAVELAATGRQPPGLAFVAGLLHDIGQLWMAYFQPLEFQMVRNAIVAEQCGVIDIERRYFGIDHCTIGRLLAVHWGLPEPVVDAIYGHHNPQALASAGPLVAVIHVAEVLASALDLGGRPENLVAGLSATACAQLGIDWSQDCSGLFGRIEARTEYASRVFR